MQTNANMAIWEQKHALITALILLMSITYFRKKFKKCKQQVKNLNLKLKQKLIYFECKKNFK